MTCHAPIVTAFVVQCHNIPVGYAGSDGRAGRSPSVRDGKAKWQGGHAPASSVPDPPASSVRQRPSQYTSGLWVGVSR